MSLETVKIASRNFHQGPQFPPHSAHIEMRLEIADLREVLSAACAAVRQGTGVSSEMHTKLVFPQEALFTKVAAKGLDPRMGSSVHCEST